MVSLRVLWTSHTPYWYQPQPRDLHKDQDDHNGLAQLTLSEILRVTVREAAAQYASHRHCRGQFPRDVVGVLILCFDSSYNGNQDVFSHPFPMRSECVPYVCREHIIAVCEVLISFFQSNTAPTIIAGFVFPTLMKQLWLLLRSEWNSTYIIQFVDWHSKYIIYSPLKDTSGWMENANFITLSMVL